MTNQQGAPEALPDPSPDQLRSIARTARNSSGSASDDCGPLAYVLHGWRAAAIAFRAHQAALVEAQQPTTHVQNPGEIEHVAGDVSKNGPESNMSTQQEEQEPCPTCAALARTVMLDQVSFDRKPDCYGIRQITDDEGIEEWEDIRTSPDVAREEANDMMATGRGEIYEVVPLWTTPQPSPTPQADSQPAPIDMVLHCPKCGRQHIDAREYQHGDHTTQNEAAAWDWDNPPHRSHLCHGCGHIWRPADVPTNGVQAVKTKGKADSPIAATAPAQPGQEGERDYPPLPEPDLGMPWRVNAKSDGAAHSSGFTYTQMRAYVDADRAARAPADSVLEDAAREVLMEHSGCGSGTQVDMLTVRLNPGDKVVMLKGRITQGIDAERADLAQKEGR